MDRSARRAVVLVLNGALSDVNVHRLALGLVLAILALSMVPLTGFSGYVSLAQFSFFGVGALVAFVSSYVTLLPGDVILTGTPKGIGSMRAGDRVEVEIEGIGVLAVGVRDGAAAFPGGLGTDRA